MSDAVEHRITLASIVRPQGRRGEVLADLFTDFPDLLKTAKGLELKRPDGTGIPTVVEDYWMPVGRNAGRVVLKLAGIDSISAAETLIHHQVQMPQEERIALAPATYYVRDLIGCDLHDKGQRVGKVTDVHFPVTSSGQRLEDAAALFIVVDDANRQVMVPFVNAYVQRIDIVAKQIVMALPHGLADLNVS